ncbi:MAG: oligopeptidase B, partial [Cyclobacteriaceae bacterium]|nr:oligopeptidase B [Cyclobacteriaceae bacterium]
MHKLRFSHVLIFTVLIILIACSPQEKKTALPDVQPPLAKIEPFEIVSKHGDKRVDNYYWLKNREDSAVINYLTAENDYLDTMMAHTKEFQEALFNEMRGRIKEDDSSV